MTDYTGEGGYYEMVAKREQEWKLKQLEKEKEALERRKATPEWEAWEGWRKAFLSSSLQHMTVRELLRGMERLNKEP